MQILIFLKLFQAARDAKIRLEKTEEEATELSNKAKTLEVRKCLGIGERGEGGHYQYC